MSYTHYWLDADHTLFDFNASERVSFANTLEKFGHKGDVDEALLAYRQISIPLWEAFERGEINKTFLQHDRFRQLGEHLSLDFVATEVNEFYLNQLPEHVVLMPGCMEACGALKEKGSLGLITNGVGSLQARRLEVAGLSDHFDFIVVSESCGFAKPDPRFFEEAMQKAGSPANESVLVVGDKLETDIKGANDFGLDSCWYNPKKMINTCHIQPKYETTDLRDIISL